MAAGVCLGIVVVGIIVPQRVTGHDIPAEMVRAAQRFTRSLTDQQRADATIAFDADRRMAWHYIPSSMMEPHGGRRGVAVKELTADQRALALGLLNTALSHPGYLQAMTIMALESILRDLENGNPARDPEMYHVAIHGTPSTEASWGWSFEGHHLSVNVTLIDGRRFAVTPSFFGSNPAVVPGGPQEGLEVLAAEQQLARELVRSLSPAQRGQAVIAEVAPSDILTGAEPLLKPDRFATPQGIPFAQLEPAQQVLLLRLVHEFAAKYREGIVEEIARRAPLSDGAGMYFAWAGGTEPGEGHYYRVQTPHFVFEYDNTQNGANHVHAVWRNLQGDFGVDLLRQHYETSPHHQPR
jgi:hypothetical protein